MNKPPQPITGPPAIPHPSQSPGLTQAAYNSGQPSTVVYPGPSSQMNTAPQPRQPYYPSRPNMQGSAPRVPPSNTTRSVAPTHVYQPTSQVMMIPQQPLNFANSQGHAIFLHGQYRPPYMPPTQQYPVSTGTAGFYGGSSPAEYGTYDPSLAGRERRGGGGRGAGRENGRLSLHGAPLTSQRYPAAAYYPATQQYQTSVPVAPVMNPSQQQAAPLPQQAPPQQTGSVKPRERKQIRIRDPNQGGRDITEEIMSGGRSTSTPTPPQTADPDVTGSVQTNGEIIQTVPAAVRAG
ncbi:hypothetical protein DNTS_029395 [Danionella cerebrum]|uniref:Eukaryotic translation initiation factor 4 gamma 1 n=1 Tax=Danionella cerebrum TaxID=2873325 RepID=A0A553QUN8_9TELE|nr:hypothetical protein DNTS_029395 [Danionella translucida]